MKIPQADSNPSISLHYNTSCMHNLHSYRVYSLIIGLLIGFNTEGGREYFIRNK